MSLAISSLDDQKRALSLIYDTAIVLAGYGLLWGLVVFLGGFDLPARKKSETILSCAVTRA